MAQLNSFDITSTIDLQEVDNGLNQARKEVGQRYDFKGARADIDFNRAESTITLVADDNMKIEALWEIVQTRLIRRNVPVKNFKAGMKDDNDEDTPRESHPRFQRLRRIIHEATGPGLCRAGQSPQQRCHSDVASQTKLLHHPDRPPS